MSRLPLHLLLAVAAVASGFTSAPLLAQQHGAAGGSPLCFGRSHRAPLRRQRALVVAASPAPAAAGPPGGAPLTIALVAVWYAASVICNQSSRCCSAAQTVRHLRLLLIA